MLAWAALLRDAGFRSPAILSVEYSLVPDDRYPGQVIQTLSAYRYACWAATNPEQICLAGDSAGGAVLLSLLLQIGSTAFPFPLPGYCVLVSPWISLVSTESRNTPSDYLDVSTLHRYGTEYLGSESLHENEYANPGACKDASKWKGASPSRGWLITQGSEEVFRPEVESFVGVLRETGQDVSVLEVGSVHAWPVASLFLGESKEARLRGLEQITKVLASKMCRERERERERSLVKSA